MRLIFVHGSGEWGEIWENQLCHFNNAEAVTLPGHPEGKLCKSVDEYTDWLHWYIENINYKDIILTGHSLGGAIVMTYALKYPNDLRAIVLVDTGARLRVHPRYLAQLEEAVNGNLDEWVEWLRWHFGKHPPEKQKVIIQKYLEIGPKSQLNDLRCCDKFDIMDRVKEIRVPTLILCGNEDAMCPVKYTEYLAAKIPEAKKVIIEGAAHFVFVDKPDEFNRAFERFITQLGQ
ncbi:alpha/beta fold hydrolase [Chloroflexota bacterium]